MVLDRRWVKIRETEFVSTFRSLVGNCNTTDDIVCVPVEQNRTFLVTIVFSHVFGAET